MAGKGNKVVSIVILVIALQKSQPIVVNFENLHRIWNTSEVHNKDENFYHFWNRAVQPEIEEDPSLYLETETLSHDIEHTGSDFPCKPFNSTTKPASVHRLKPSDVDVVAALGDSITAAFGTKSSDLLTLFVEFRGVSWSIGGDKTLDQVTTLPNILKKYNSRVRGFSVRVTPPLIPFPINARLDVAVSGKSSWLVFLLQEKHRYELALPSELLA